MPATARVQQRDGGCDDVEPWLLPVAHDLPGTWKAYARCRSMAESRRVAVLLLLRRIDLVPGHARDLRDEIRIEARRALEAGYRNRAHDVAARVIHRPRVDRLHSRDVERRIAAEVA